MPMMSPKQVLPRCILAIAILASATLAFAPVTVQFSNRKANDPTRTRTDPLLMATVPPSSSSTVGVLGAGFISILTAKLAALAGYQTWLIYPADEKENIKELLGGEEIPSNLDLIAASADEEWAAKLPETDAMFITVDGDIPMNENTVEYVLNPENLPKLKRVVAMSRNLNGKDMGFFVKASKVSANREVWDNSTGEQFKKFEGILKKQAKACNAEYTIARAGTLKGGACGEDTYDQYLSRKYYDMTKKDIVCWQLLFDCKVRGVSLKKGDTMPGPGVKAVFTATSNDESPGDTSRCGIDRKSVV